jgi:hypothetical protein
MEQLNKPLSLTPMIPEYFVVIGVSASEANLSDIRLPPHPQTLA